MEEKPTNEQMTAALQNLASSMETVAILLHRWGRDDKAKELNGAATMLHDWYRKVEAEV